jgi:hypothetical protein
VICISNLYSFNLSQSLKKQRWLWLALLSTQVVLFSSLSTSAVPSDIPVRVNRWLAIESLEGNVTFLTRSASRSARLGDRLQTVGDGVVTATSSEATLEVDTQIGSIEVAEQTSVKVRALEVTANDGRVTRLQVDRGRVRLQVRPFSNPESELEIETPAGITGVRGTDFGVNVDANGKMGVATLEGNVLTSAQGENVEVPAGFQNVTIPGEPPLEPIPFTNEPRLDYQVDRVIRRGIRRVVFNGQVDPTSSVTIKGEPQTIDRDGRFQIVFPAPSRLRLSVTVTTALGKTQTYDLQLL